MCRSFVVLALLVKGAESWWWPFSSTPAPEEKEESCAFEGSAPPTFQWLVPQGCLKNVSFEEAGNIVSRDIFSSLKTSGSRPAVIVRPNSVELCEDFWLPATNGKFGGRCEDDAEDEAAVYYYDEDVAGEAPNLLPPRYDNGKLQIHARLNGDFGAASTGVSLAVPLSEESFDDFLKRACELVVAETIGMVDIVGNASGEPLKSPDTASCDPAMGARAFDATGTRIESAEALVELAKHRFGVKGYPLQGGWEEEAAADLWLVPASLHWVWPTVAAGHSTLTSVDDMVVTVTTLSMQPAVFRIQGFLNAEEAKATVDRNRPRIKPSEVGLVGRAGDKTRTSSNAWDTSSPEARVLIKRAFGLLKIDPERKLEDGLQVLHYEKEQWYKPHVDYFTQNNGGGGGVAADAFSNAVPQENNGTNRFATVFLYLSDSAEGGETVFPHSTTHLDYRGGFLTSKGTIKTPGFIRNEDAKWVCNTSSEALRVKPAVAEAVLFYSQRGDGSLDPYSLHGSCPIGNAEHKWAANLWVWNRPRDKIDSAKAKAKKKNAGGDEASATANNGFTATFHNHHPELVQLHWSNGDALTKMADIPPEESLPMNTFFGHTFVATDASGENHLAEFKMNPSVLDLYIKPISSKRPQPRPKKSAVQPPKVFDEIEDNEL